MHYLKSQPHYFPHPFAVDEHGILAIGASLDPDTLVMAYSIGIFPWNTPDEPTLWWYTFPRLILRPTAIKISKSMRKIIRDAQYTVTFNQEFERVISHCQKIKREGQSGTWLSDELKQSFITLHGRGIAHSVEVWAGEELIGGLYGVSIGKVFCGESMFTLRPNASKFALIKLCELLEGYEFTCIDCQQETAHLKSMGGEVIGGGEFYDILVNNQFHEQTYLRKCLDEGELKAKEA